MNIKDIILFILIIVIIYLIYKTRNLEKFDLTTDIQTAVNNQYDKDKQSIMNIGKILSHIKNNDNSLNIQSDSTITNRLIVNGDLEVDGNINITDKNTKILEIFPRFMVIAWAPVIPNTIPKGWALCDGNSYILNSDGTVSVSSSSSSIKTPDLRGRFVLGEGQGTSLSNRNFNDKGGVEKHKLLINQIPSHKHARPLIDVIKVYGIGEYQHHPDYEGGKHTMAFTDKTGGDQPHENMPPFYVLYYIMKL